MAPSVHDLIVDSKPPSAIRYRYFLYRFATDDIWSSSWWTRVPVSKPFVIVCFRSIHSCHYYLLWCIKTTITTTTTTDTRSGEHKLQIPSRSLRRTSKRTSRICNQCRLLVFHVQEIVCFVLHCDRTVLDFRRLHERFFGTMLIRCLILQHRLVCLSVQRCIFNIGTTRHAFQKEKSSKTCNCVIAAVMCLCCLLWTWC